MGDPCSLLKAQIHGIESSIRRPTPAKYPPQSAVSLPISQNPGNKHFYLADSRPLYAGTGSYDTLAGGGGNDTFHIGGAANHDTIDGGSGHNVVDFDNHDSHNVTYTPAGGGATTVHFTDTGQTFKLEDVQTLHFDDGHTKTL